MTKKPLNQTRLSLDYIDIFVLVDLAIVFCQLLFTEFDDTVHQRKNGVILAQGGIFTGEEFGTPLSDNDIAGPDNLTAKNFDTESLGD